MDFGTVADEARFLWGQWERALRGGTGTLIHFVDGVDERLLAAEEALARAPSDLLRGWFDKALNGSAKKNDVTVMALALLISDAKDAGDRILQAFESHPQHRGHLGRALEVCWTELTDLLLGWLRKARSVPAVAAALRALSFRAVPLRAEVDPFLRAGDEEVLEGALSCVPFAAAPDVRSVELALRSERDSIRSAAQLAALRIDPRLALQDIRNRFDRREGSLDLASIALAISASPADLERLEQAAGEPVLRRQALWALGLSGSVIGADVCLRALDDEEVLDVAVEGFEAISGIRLPAAADQPKQNDGSSPSQATVATVWTAPPFEERPLIDVSRARADWNSRRRTLVGRLWAGVPLTGDTIATALKREPLRRRHARALEIEVRTKGGARLQTLGWGWRQLRDMSRLHIPTSVSCQDPIDRAR